MRQYYIVTETGEEVDYFEIEMLRHGCFGGGEIPADILIFTGSLDPKRLIAQLTPAKDKILVALIEHESGSVYLQCTKDEQNQFFSPKGESQKERIKHEFDRQ